MGMTVSISDNFNYPMLDYTQVPRAITTTSTSSVCYEDVEDLEDLGCNADLYALNDETFQGCRVFE